MPRNLIIVRAGDKSLHTGWLGNQQERNFDVIVNYYDDNPDLYRDQGQRRIDSKSTKWPALHKLIGELMPELEAYDYIWLPDDDLASDMQNVNRLFDICRDYKMDLAQPALTPDSIIGNAVTLRNRSFLLRYTNFVEIMAPCFSLPFLKKCWPTFTANRSGYGLDYVWPRMTDNPFKIGIIDACLVKHTQSRGPSYDIYKADGIVVEEEYKALMIKEKIRPLPLIYGGIDWAGNQNTLWNGGHQQLIRSIMAGYLPEMGQHSETLFQIIAPLLGFVGATPSMPPDPPLPMAKG